MLSVIIPIYNGQEDILELLNCLTKQTYPPDQVEYIVIDNNSQDRTLELLSAVRNPNIKILTATIQSSYAARNVGIKAASGDIIVFTDVDCRPEPNWLLELVKPFENDPDLLISVGEIIALPGTTLLEQHAQQQDTLSAKYAIAHPYHPYGQTANLAIRQTIFKQIGLFRPYLTTGGDADICWRILKQASKDQLKFQPQAIVKHRHRNNWRSLYKQWYRYGTSNKYLHQLHGIELMRPLTPSEFLYRITRWIIKELPINIIKLILKQSTYLDLINTPIQLFTQYARTKGQQEANLPDQAQEIELI